MSENTENKDKCPAAPAAAVRAGYKVGYVVQVGDKQIISRGEVFSVRRTGHDEIEITLLHAKTGALFTNKLKAGSPVVFTEIKIDPETTDGLAQKLLVNLMKTLKEQVSEFYTLMPVED